MSWDWRPGQRGGARSCLGPLWRMRYFGLVVLLLLLLNGAASAAATSRRADDWPLPQANSVAPANTARLALAQRVVSLSNSLHYGPDGRLDAVFGVPRAEAQMVFYPVSQLRALPDGYEPADLAGELGAPLRKLVLAEFAAMFDAAERDGAFPQIVSGYRSADYQAFIFEQGVQRQLYRGDDLSRQDAERRTARFIAPPGHSQHQLGTTADLSSWEIGYALRSSFAETVAGRWLAQHAWEYGFVQPYTPAAEARTGYGPEPWHYRWVGRPLAAWLWAERYLTSGYPTVDDVLAALEELLP